MTRLSIIIPMLGSAELMEAGLVSVLENRPPDCEVLLVLNDEYANPYQLDDEVRFLQASRGASWVQSVNLGIQDAAGEIVHVLAPGVEVREGWTESALAHFADERVAAVSPLVVDARKPKRVLAAGVAFRRGRRRMLAKPCLAAESVVGPTWAAGFYRKRVVEALGGFAPCVGDAYADIDLAVRLSYLGREAVIEPAAVVSAAALAKARAGFRDGLCAERLFLRHIGAAGGWRAALARPLVMAGGFLARLWHPPKALLHLTGRLLAWCGLPFHIGQRRRVCRLAQQLVESKVPARPTGTRIDASHEFAPSLPCATPAAVAQK